jgi:hypothetical protein
MVQEYHMSMKINFTQVLDYVVYRSYPLEHTRMFFLHNQNEMLAFWLGNTMVGEEEYKRRCGVPQSLLILEVPTQSSVATSLLIGFVYPNPILRSLETFLQSPYTFFGLRVVRSNTVMWGSPAVFYRKMKLTGPTSPTTGGPFFK